VVESLIVRVQVYSSFYFFHNTGHAPFVATAGQSLLAAAGLAHHVAAAATPNENHENLLYQTTNI
jgi:hypothetical protein